MPFDISLIFSKRTAALPQPLPSVFPLAVVFCLVNLLLFAGGICGSESRLLCPAGDFQSPASPEGPHSLTERGLENVVTFTRLLGYVRYFHPSDQAAETDWPHFAVRGIREVEDARDAEMLTARLNALFHPIAPTLRLFPTGQKPEPPHPALTPPKGTAEVVFWHHTGCGSDEPQSAYRSERRRGRVRDGKLPAGFPDPQQPFAAEIGGGVSCLLPTALFADARGTLPPSKVPPEADTPLTAQDRFVRLADVALAWNIPQHFYPYFDLSKTDWPRALRFALAAAATDADAQAFHRTLRRMIAALNDGHGSVLLQSDPNTYTVPLWLTWTENHLVVLGVPGTGLRGIRPGDVIQKIDGRPVEEALALQEELISSATPQWKRYRAVREMLLGPQNSDVTLEIQSETATPRSLTLTRTLARADFARSEMRYALRPAKIAEVRPGVFYLDIERITDKDFQNALPKLMQARGILFDFRGYPSGIENPMALLARLAKQPITSAQWHIPIITQPDRKDMTFRMSRWPETPPSEPSLSGKIAFLTDGSAISYAESCLGIVEHYRLGVIVGGPTAGTNGNVNPFTLPGGYRVAWTGMKVLKHDGSRHHGVGIQPTVPVSPTRAGITAGRDEILEKALEVVSRQ